jgi:hypothetical protein
MQDFQVIGSLAAEQKHMTRKGVSLQHLNHLCRQPVKAIAHADRLTGQLDLGAGGDLDHDVAFNTESTRCSARSLTNASTRSRVPFARSISIRPGRPSISERVTAAGTGGGLAGETPAISAGPSSAR